MTTNAGRGAAQEPLEGGGGSEGLGREVAAPRGPYSPGAIGRAEALIAGDPDWMLIGAPLPTGEPDTVPRHTVVRWVEGEGMYPRPGEMDHSRCIICPPTSQQPQAGDPR